MPFRPDTLSAIAAARFDTVIDVRSPSEFARDHLPGALNLPVLDDDERARVGTLYTQVSPFDARKLGAALVARNTARHLEQSLAHHPGGWRPLVYCWRGGMRSNAFALILRQIGWRAEVLEGGYKTWRHLVATMLYERPLALRVVLLEGNTGTAKTELLPHLAALGVQCLDLEALAGHRGSLFGAQGPQPAQTGFESRLAGALDALDPARPLLLEAESARIGDIRLPPALWEAMKAAPRIALTAPLAERARYLARTYADIAADPARISATIDALRPFQPAERIAAWQALAAAGAHAALCEGLMQHHYDPRYARHRARGPAPAAVIAADSLAPDALPALAARISAALCASSG